MGAKKWLDPQRMDIVIAVLIALVSLTASLAAWRTNVVGSNASDANRQGLIDAVKKGSAQSEDWRRVYEEAGFARDFFIASAAIEAEEASGDESYQSAAAQQRQYLLPGMQSLSQSLSAPGEYLNPDGTPDNAPIRAIGVLIIISPLLFGVITGIFYAGGLILKALGHLKPLVIAALVPLASVVLGFLMILEVPLVGAISSTTS